MENLIEELEIHIDIVKYRELGLTEEEIEQIIIEQIIGSYDGQEEEAMGTGRS